MAEVVSRVRRVLVGFDGSVTSRAALGWAVEEARLHGAALEVWTVVEAPPPGVPDAGDDAAAVLDDLRSAALTVTGGSGVEFRVGRGRAAAVLCAACDDSDLLVVGSRGRSPFAGLLLGSVSRACLSHAPCSVAVIGPDVRAQSHGRVVVGIDASEASRRALNVAAQEAILRGDGLNAVHAVHWDHLGVELLEPTARQLVTWGRELVRSELAESGVDARSEVLSGNPSDVLVRHSATADLLVLGSRGHNPLATLALGSTSDYCIRHAACPVMIVRPPRSDES